METEKNGAALWPRWETVRLLGRGSFGEVWEIEREVFGHWEKAALKRISIPRSETEIEELYSSGYDDKSITEHFREFLTDIVREYTMMAEMKGHTNVVYCDDIRYVQHDDGFGWDIYIKMELLTPLMKALPDSGAEEEITKLGRDICRALVLCRSRNIIHRDIKPQNIFVSPDGDYKLGDFGVAKTMEKTSGGTKIGTFSYMAPEVYNNKPYGHTADICSLGLVLYWLLNERRLPFTPLPPLTPKSAETELARMRRFAGEPLPPPAHGSKGLKRIVLKACEYDPKDRYQTAEDMLRDLEALAGIVPGGAGGERSAPRPAAAPAAEQAVRQVRSKESPPRAAAAPAKKSAQQNKNRARCVKCGAPLESGTKYCTRCGAAQKKKNGRGAAVLIASLAALAVLAVGLYALIGGAESSSGKKTAKTRAADQTLAADVVVIEENDGPAAEHVHEWSDWSVEREPDCENPGVQVRTCLLDESHQERQPIPALGHDWQDATTSAPRTCRRCGRQEGSPLAPAPATTPVPEPAEPAAALTDDDYQALADRCRAHDAEIELPTRSEMLDQPVTMYVKGSHPNDPNGGMWLCRHPKKDGVVVIRSHTPVTVYAVRDGSIASKTGCAFVETNTGAFGWISFQAASDDGLSVTNDF